MISKVVISSLLLAALANGLVIKRDDGYDSNTPAISLPTVTPPPIRLPDPDISLSLPPLDPSPTGSLATISLPDPSISLSLPPLDQGSIGSPTTTPPPGPTFSLPDPTISLSLPPLDPSSSGTPTATPLSYSSLPSVVTTTVYVYPTQCSPTGSPPTPIPSGGTPGDVGALPQDEPVTIPSGTPITLPGPQGTPLVLPPVRRDEPLMSQLDAIRQQLISTGQALMPAIDQLGSIIAQAANLQR
jgi:hypothetical protein